MSSLNRSFLLIIIVSFVASTAGAVSPLISSFDVNTGFSSFRLKTGDFQSNLDSVYSLEANYNLKHAAWSTAYSMSFFELVEAQGRKLPYTRFSLGVRWYPMGMNGGRVIFDQGVSAQVWKSTPFIGLGVGLANVSINEANASMMDFSPRFGVELPFSTNFFLQGQLTLSSGTGGGAGASAGGVVDYKQISYQGLSALVGLIYSGL